MNTHSARTRRSLAALAAGGVLTLATALPATSAVLPDPLGNGSSSSVVEVPVAFDDNALEFVQIGLGALGGIALASVGVAAVRARRHHHPQLA